MFEACPAIAVAFTALEEFGKLLLPRASWRLEQKRENLPKQTHFYPFTSVRIIEHRIDLKYFIWFCQVLKGFGFMSTFERCIIFFT